MGKALSVGAMVRQRERETLAVWGVVMSFAA